MPSPEAGLPKIEHRETGAKKQTPEKGLGFVDTAKAVVLFTLVGAALGWKEKAEKINQRNQAIADALDDAVKADGTPEGPSDDLRERIRTRITNQYQKDIDNA